VFSSHAPYIGDMIVSQTGTEKVRLNVEYSLRKLYRHKIKLDTGKKFFKIPSIEFVRFRKKTKKESTVFLLEVSFSYN
jgi:hypothetical protein